MEKAGKLTSTGGMAPLAYAKSIGRFHHPGADRIFRDAERGRVAFVQYL